MSNTPIRQLADRLRFDFRHAYQGDRVRLFPVRLKLANNFVDVYHRHTGRTSRDGGRYAIGAVRSGRLCGVVIVGNPLSATLMDGVTAEVLRLCVDPEATSIGLCSQMYSAAYRAWKAMGGLRMITYTLLDAEPGTSLKAAGWSIVGTTNPSWGAWSSKTGADGITRNEQAVLHLKKNRWEIVCPEYQQTVSSMKKVPKDYTPDMLPETYSVQQATEDAFWEFEL